MILQYSKASFLLAAIFSAFCFANTANGQQHIIADKNNTRPETTMLQPGTVAAISFFSVMQTHGFNEIQWRAMREENTRRYIVEYSSDGINYQSAGEVLVTDGVYSLKHYTDDTRSLLYRLRMELHNKNRPYYSISLLLEGTDHPPVKVYPTIIEGNVFNAQLYFPVHNVTVTSAEGKQIFTKDLGGSSGLVQLTMPAASGRGIYLVTFYGDGWKHTVKVMTR